MTRPLTTVLALVMLAGCDTRSYTPTVRYTLTPDVTVAKSDPSDRTLAIRPFEAARPYGQMIVYRDANSELGQYENVEWAELPRDAVVRTLLDAVIATGRFADAGLATNMTQPNLILTGQLRKFDLDRTAKPWTAVCEVRLELRETFGTALLYGETLTATQPLAENEIAALPPAMSAAVSQVIQKAATEIASK